MRKALDKSRVFMTRASSVAHTLASPTLREPGEKLLSHEWAFSASRPSPAHFEEAHFLPRVSIGGKLTSLEKGEQYISLSI
jgi:hypothetical protein